MTEKVPQAGI
uniref:Uncharacterized protein n=1 Tax=Rhizophora mucronata TaxID=61149 RepID=A0A2P2JU00_RHIMU